MAIKHPAAPVRGRYRLESLPIAGSRVRRLAPGDFDPSRHAQQAPAAVIAAIDLVHRRSGSPLAALIAFVYSALTWRARAPPVSPERGSVRVQHGLNPAAVQQCVDSSGLRHLRGINWTDALDYGADDLYFGRGAT